MTEDFYRESKVIAHLRFAEDIALQEQRGMRGFIKEPLEGWIDLYLDDGHPTIVGNDHDLPESPRLIKDDFDKVQHATFVEKIIRERWEMLTKSVDIAKEAGIDYKHLIEVSTRQNRGKTHK